MPSADVDLHQYVLNITMPHGQPTVLVALAIKEDMWIRPKLDVGLGSTAPNRPAAEDPRFWILCLWTQSIGLGADGRFLAFPFWLEGNQLLPAIDFQPKVGLNDPVATNSRDYRHDALGGHCYAFTESLNRPKAIASSEPRSGILVVALAAWTGNVSLPGSMGFAAPPPFSLRLGIGHPCPEDIDRYCAPPKDHAVTPALRGGPLTHATFYNYLDELNGTCSACGFDMREDRIEQPLAGQGSFWSGHVELARQSAHGPGIGFIDTSLGGTGDEELRTVVNVDGTVVAAACSGSDAHILQFLFEYDQSFEVHATYTATGDHAITASTMELPLDLTALGWTLPTHVASFTTTSYYGAPDSSCGSAAWALACSSMCRSGGMGIL